MKAKTENPTFYGGDSDYSPVEVIDNVNDALRFYGLRCSPINENEDGEDYEIVKIKDELL